jgi:hypothetical protein
MGLKCIGQIYKYCKHCNAETLEYSSFIGQILYFSTAVVCGIACQNFCGG